MAARYVTLDICVHPVTYKYLSFHYDTSPFVLSGGNSANVLSSYLYNCLDRYGHYDTKLPKRCSKLTASLTVGIPDWVARHGHGVKLTPAKVLAFDTFAQQRFYEAMTMEVTLRMAAGKGIVEVTQQILNRYGLSEEELGLLKALRYYARYKEKMFPQMLVDDCHKNVATSVVTL